MANPGGTPQNLKPFPKGVSGNPTGRRPGLSLTRLVRDQLEKPAAEGAQTTKAEILASMIVNLAIAGDRVLIPLVWRYVDGEPKDARSASLREIAERIAARTGEDAQQLLEAFERDMGAA